MAITIIIDNHHLDQRTVMMVGYDDIIATESVWETIHPIAKILVSAGLAEEPLPWSQFTTRHYQLLIKRQLESFTDLSVDEQHDINHNTVNTLRFLLCAYVRKLSELTGSDVDVIRVQKVGPADFSFNVSLNVVLASGPKKEKALKPDFKVIVDNTKEEE